MTMFSFDVYALIPAREGSKGIKLKNISNVNDKPLLYWIVKSAIISNVFKDIYLSTESRRIKDIALSYFPALKIINRPLNLASDTATSESVVAHAIESQNLKSAMGIALLQPTSPLTSPESIKEAVMLYKNRQGNCSVVTVTKEFGYIGEQNQNDKNIFNPFRIIRYRRQDMKPFLKETGAVYIAPPRAWLKGIRLYHPVYYVNVPKIESYEVDDEIDVAIVDMLMRRKLNGIF